MFCPKCGKENPDTARFCRSCGTDLGNVSAVLSGDLPKPQAMLDRRGKPMSWESGITKICMGLAFLAVSISLGATGIGKGWWFWMLIPSFAMIGSGIARIIQIKRAEQHGFFVAPQTTQNVISSTPQTNTLPPTQTEFIAPDSRFKTGDLVPPSVVENTTRLLETDSEGETMTLPKK